VCFGRFAEHDRKRHVGRKQGKRKKGLPQKTMLSGSFGETSSPAIRASATSPMTTTSAAYEATTYPTRRCNREALCLNQPSLQRCEHEPDCQHCPMQVKHSRQWVYFEQRAQVERGRKAHQHGDQQRDLSEEEEAHRGNCPSPGKIRTDVRSSPRHTGSLWLLADAGG
jgi:hypothetical protein